jgi:hypothetical protein
VGSVRRPVVSMGHVKGILDEKNKQGFGRADGLFAGELIVVRLGMLPHSVEGIFRVAQQVVRAISCQADMLGLDAPLCGGSPDTQQVNDNVAKGGEQRLGQ